MFDGGEGQDTYFFNKGHGKDAFISTNNQGDSWRFEGILSTSVLFKKHYSNLVIFGYNGEDSVTVRNFFGYRNSSVGTLLFDDMSIENPDFLNHNYDNQAGYSVSILNHGLSAGVDNTHITAGVETVF